MITVATRDEKRGSGVRPGEPRPGLVLVYSGRAPLLRAIPLGEAPITLGRDDAGGAPLPDDRMSRQHVRVSEVEGAIVVEDLGSRNGTFVDGARIAGRAVLASASVIRAGSTVLVPTRDVRAYLGERVEIDGDVVVGPALVRAREAIAAAGQGGDTLLLFGESGVGKENAARHFHASTRAPSGPFVAVNCAAIPATVAERLLFGAKRGAYSGATEDADGFCTAADGGTLFLDEIGELPLDVQAKLLRFLETHELFPLGASKPRRVSARVCCATHRDLRELVARGTFRADLFYRLSIVEVRIPPLRERPEEIGWLIHHALARAGREVAVHATFVEACLRRPWPGNARELLGAVRRALHALRDGKVLSSAHLDASAGLAPTTRAPPADEAAVDAPPVARSGEIGERERMIEALQRTGGNQTRAAELLGMSRRTFIRRLEELDVPRPRVGRGVAERTG